jgi:hypothetical protein
MTQPVVEQPDTVPDDVVMPSIAEMQEAMHGFVAQHALAPTDEPLPDDPDPEFGPDERL